MAEPEERSAQARRDLDRLGQQTEKLFGAGHPRPPEDDADEPAVIWGKRIGRSLGFVVLIWLAWHLLTTYILRP